MEYRISGTTNIITLFLQPQIYLLKNNSSALGFNAWPRILQKKEDFYFVGEVREIKMKRHQGGAILYTSGRPHIGQAEAESLSQLHKLDEMRERLESRELVIVNMSMHTKVLKEKVKKQEEQLSTEIRSLLIAGTALSVASKSLQEANKSLAGERGYTQLKDLQKLLRVRQQYVVSQVSLLYPVKVVVGHASEQELESFTCSKSENPSGLKPLDQGSFTISGLHLTFLPFTKMSFFTDKEEVQRSATALGYVAQAVSLIASYLEVPLRYPLRIGGSLSYIRDCAPSIEPTSIDSSLSSLKPIEFPLFIEGQDTTRAAYAVFLMNKDLEQLLNFIGVNSLGPRHVLANLKKLIKTILNPEYLI